MRATHRQRERAIGVLRGASRFVPTATAIVEITTPPAGSGPWTIGRSRSCRLMIDDDTVSRRHAELRRRVLTLR